jgi:hypothetical protein
VFLIVTMRNRLVGADASARRGMKILKIKNVHVRARSLRTWHLTSMKKEFGD